MFTKVAIPVLNQVVRLFTAKWHKSKVDGTFSARTAEFREDLKELQPELNCYASLLSEIAGVEDFTGLVNPLDD